MRWARLLWAVIALQVALGGRVVWRLARTARGERVVADVTPAPARERVAIIIPVLDERARLAPCLEGAIAQPAEVIEILVVDGGSTDNTPELIRDYAARDPRVRLVGAAPVPDGWNGKAHGLQVGLEAAAAEATCFLTLDADVRPGAVLTRSLLAHARRHELRAFSVATLQRLSGTAEGLVHPALLATLVYRFGIPGHATRRVEEVQANGQCLLVRRDLVEQAGGFGAAWDSLCEDVTLARRLVRLGEAVGFYETDGLIDAAMYTGWRDTWRNWTRSLPMRDRYQDGAALLGLAEVTFVQALPLPLTLVGLLLGRRRASLLAAMLVRVNGALLAVRLGTLIGMARAYAARPWTYWWSPLVDLPAALRLWMSALRRRHVWRGREIVRGGTEWLNRGRGSG
jgi:dolichol-phosphate mannosyltransferase